ncbi:MAG: RidA family protein [Sphingomonadaceae bacterium]
MSVAKKLEEMGLVLPAPAAAVASYVPCVRTDNLLHISGQLPFETDGTLILGRLGDSMDVTAGQYAARRSALGILAQVRAAVGDFDQVSRIVKLGVFVASAPNFTDQPEVANGASDLFLELFGDAGKHARSAVGVSALPRGVAVEVDAIIQLR